MSRNGTPENYGVDVADKLLWTNTQNSAPVDSSGTFNRFQYDAFGNLTHRERASGGPVTALDFRWDTAGRLRSVYQGGGSIFSGTYSADGERISVSEGNQSRLSSFRLFDDAYGNGTNTPITHTPGLAQRKNGSDRLYSTDHLGSTRYLTGTDPLDPDYKFGARYDAYGQRTAGAGSDGPDATPRQYAGAWGYERSGDTLGLDYLYQRYYDPAVGRFISRDPIGWAGGLNLFGYVDNDPINGVDPSGLSGVNVNYEEGEIPLSRGHMFAQESAVFAADPVFKPGSAERCRYSGLMNYVPVVGQAKVGIETITGRDYVSGTRVGDLQRALAFVPLLSKSAGGVGRGGGSLWNTFEKWVTRIAKKGLPKHANYYDGPTHVYSIHVIGMVWKIGTGNGAASDGISPRAAKQVRMLNKIVRHLPFRFTYKVRRGYPGAESAHHYETQIIQRYSSRHGRPPGNPVER